MLRSRKNRTRAALLASLLGTLLATPDVPADSFDSAGQDLASRVRQARPEQEGQVSGQLKIRRRGEPMRYVPLQFSVALTLDSWTLEYRAAATNGRPAQKLTIVCSATSTNGYRLSVKPSDDAQWPDAQPLGRSELAAPLGGSDFWMLDLGMEFLHWPGQRLIKAEMRRGRPCRVLESTPLNPATQAYGRVVTWLDNETGRPIQAEAYDAQDRLLKEFSLDSFKRIDGQWQLESMKIRNVQTRSTTWIEFELE